MRKIQAMFPCLAAALWLAPDAMAGTPVSVKKQPELRIERIPLKSGQTPLWPANPTELFQPRRPAHAQPLVLQPGIEIMTWEDAVPVAGLSPLDRSQADSGARPGPPGASSWRSPLPKPQAAPEPRNRQARQALKTLREAFGVEKEGKPSPELLKPIFDGLPPPSPAVTTR